MSKIKKVSVENVIRPAKAPGLTLAEIRERIFAHLPEEKFPGGRGVSWWSKPCNSI
ncbi:DUF6958 family protein [Sinorhizobium americanum]|uniref:Uncharacterized protein n=1 Tax=Sinorhizobium americanum TaxID=194963 RepID=A0A1L3LIL2_9HYPH|nr:hypothetical protein [Sinorhizobium americanum]APG83314.1 hypothetical protein SAMCCGM7_Ch0526 [Sinorhizobium americanum CCGM7]APG89853.1 hypothetical protein SAMCFNEI73_Ch0524 [Sinorhizobium americanum]TCN36322.1 hypothetical protein EV184_101312 [Sinorhizobium americanum]